MKRLLITSFIVAFTLCNLVAQITITGVSGGAASQKPPKIIDTTLFQVTYEVLSVRDSLAPDKFAEDIMVLQIGKHHISKYYNDSERKRDSLLQAMMPQLSAQLSAGGNLNLDMRSLRDQGYKPGSGDLSVVFKNWPAGKITVTDKLMTTQYLYTEPSNEMVWQILPETDTILSYFCQKAVTDFRGRRYEAWFTPDIPINEGPWKFSGLPGLILKVSDTRQHYVFQCTGLEQTETPIGYAELNYLKTNRKDLAKVKRKFAEDPIGAIEAMNSSMSGRVIRIEVKNADGSTNPEGIKSMNLRYNPIELD